jgi:hypothetical protein
MIFDELEQHILTQARAALDLYVQPPMQRAGYAARSTQEPIGVCVRLYRLHQTTDLTCQELVFGWRELHDRRVPVDTQSFESAVRSLMGTGN